MSYSRCTSPKTSLTHQHLHYCQSEQPGWGRPDEANALYASFQECGRQPACQGQCRSAIDMIMMLMTVQMPPLLFFVANMLVRFSFDQWYDYDIHNDRANGPSLNKECYCKHALQSQCGSVLWLWILLLLKMEFHCKRLTPRKWPVEFKEKPSTAFRCSSDRFIGTSLYKTK